MHEILKACSPPNHLEVIVLDVEAAMHPPNAMPIAVFIRSFQSATDRSHTTCSMSSQVYVKLSTHPVRKRMEWSKPKSIKTKITKTWTLKATHCPCCCTIAATAVTPQKASQRSAWEGHVQHRPGCRVSSHLENLKWSFHIFYMHMLFLYIDIYIYLPSIIYIIICLYGYDICVYHVKIQSQIGCSTSLNQIVCFQWNSLWPWQLRPLRSQSELLYGKGEEGNFPAWPGSDETGPKGLAGVSWDVHSS